MEKNHICGGDVARPKNMSFRHLCPLCKRYYLSTMSSVTLVAATSVVHVKVLLRAHMRL